ncbi:MAG: ATP-binding protein [Defluviitaleaceae bacterium]|nr:ATP-binding protein [Defluviitaleaceae bacterium]
MLNHNGKNVLIFGSSRAGKTTLTRRINKELGYNIAGVNYYVDAVIKAYPQLQIKQHGEIQCVDDFMHTIASVTPFLAHSFCAMARNSYALNGKKFVAEIEIFDIDKLMPLMDEILKPAGIKKEDAFIFIALANIATKDELYNNLKKHDTEHDWTKNSTDEELKQFCELHHKDAEGMKWQYEIFKKHNFKIYNTSGNRNQIFDKIIEDVKFLT